MKLATIEENKNVQGVMNVLTKISEKIQTIEEIHNELNDRIKDTKEQIDQKLKENVQKISALVDKPLNGGDGALQNSDIYGTRYPRLHLSFCNFSTISAGSGKGLSQPPHSFSMLLQILTMLLWQLVQILKEI